jgi:hypothetical protein
MYRVSASTPPFAASYDAQPLKADRPWIDEMFTIDPEILFSMKDFMAAEQPQ